MRIKIKHKDSDIYRLLEAAKEELVKEHIDFMIAIDVGDGIYIGTNIISEQSDIFAQLLPVIPRETIL